MTTKNPDKKIIACYCRVSTEMQREKESIEAQRSRLESYCRDQGEEPTFYLDDGYSAKNTDRPALINLINDIKSGKIEMVVLTKIDRITRSIRDLLEILELFEDHNVSFKSITQPIDTKTAMGRSFIRIIGEFAQLEREIISERVTEDKRYRAKKGVWNGGIHPFGYKSVKKKLVINEPEAEVVRLIFKKFLQIETYLGVTEWLNENGYKPRYGAKWSTTSVKRLLTNPAYIGTLTYGKRKTTKTTNRYKNCPKEDWITAEGEHESIIEKDQFKDVAKLIKKKGVKKSRKNTVNDPYLLTGLIKCGKCGSAMHGQTIRKPKKTHIYYVCSGPRINGKTKCTGTQIPAGVIDTQVVNTVLQMSSSKQSIAALRKTVVSHNKRYSDDRTPIQKKLIALNKQKEKLENRKGSLMDMMLDGVFSQSDCEKKGIQLDEDLKETNKQIYQAENYLNNLETDSIDFNNIFDTIKVLKSDWKYYAIEAKQAALSALINKVTVIDKKHGEIEMYFSPGNIDLSNSSLLTIGNARDSKCSVNTTKSNALTYHKTLRFKYADHMGLRNIKGFGGRLKRWRVNIGLEQKELASLLGKHRGTIQGWEAGKWEPGGIEKEQILNMIKGA